ncbi:hypothetical protein [Thalassovita sp.]|uniref:hypothetical protein n=1 Tax=Thalassovita sp. TaxID=1979401 RepID=UPI002B27435A|nr:hypothetical protein [Thalassovita sp.]
MKLGKANALAHLFCLHNIYLPKAETSVVQGKGRPIGFVALIGNELAVPTA